MEKLLLLRTYLDFTLLHCPCLQLFFKVLSSIFLLVEDYFSEKNRSHSFSGDPICPKRASNSDETIFKLIFHRHSLLQSYRSLDQNVLPLGLFNKKIISFFLCVRTLISQKIKTFIIRRSLQPNIPTKPPGWLLPSGLDRQLFSWEVLAKRSSINVHPFRLNCASTKMSKKLSKTEKLRYSNSNSSITNGSISHSMKISINNLLQEDNLMDESSLPPSVGILIVQNC